jgi:hypothetical protein
MNRMGACTAIAESAFGNWFVAAMVCLFIVASCDYA